MFGDGDGVTAMQAGGGMTSETGSNYHVGDGVGVVGDGETLTEIDGKKYVTSAAIPGPVGKTGAQ